MKAVTWKQAAGRQAGLFSWKGGWKGVESLAAHVAQGCHPVRDQFCSSWFNSHIAWTGVNLDFIGILFNL